MDEEEDGSMVWYKETPKALLGTQTAPADMEIDGKVLAKGKKFLKAVSVLNVGKTKKPHRNEVEKAVDDLYLFMSDDPGRLRRCASRAASFSASILQLTMTLVEHLDH